MKRLALAWCHHLLLLTLLFCIIGETFTKKSKSNCEVCDLIVHNFQKGLEKTVQSNYGGGNTGWEEKSLGKWLTSETRLIEILEKICLEKDSEKENTKCNLFFEDNEEILEEWYFNAYKNDQSTADQLRSYLCVEKTKVCCEENAYGAYCLPCPHNELGICSDHGKCNGAGTKEGTGVCECQKGYTGAVCDECKERFYTHSVHNGGEEHSVCLECHQSCELNCTGGNPTDCEKCATGYSWDEEKGCTDVNECLVDPDDDPVCDDNEFCKNTEGSFRCSRCHSACIGCTGEWATDCLKCADGFKEVEVNVKSGKQKECQDENECLYDVCKPIANSKCVNNPGSYKCECVETHEWKNNECVAKLEDTAEEKSRKMAEESKEQKKREDNSGKAKGKGSSRSKKSNQAKSEEVNPSDKYTAGKHKYRALDTMILVSATGLYLILCLVCLAETVRTTALTLVYALFLYKFSGQFL